MDRFLSLMSLALAVASLVPSFTETRIKTKIKSRTISVIISVFLIGSIGMLSWSMFVERQQIDKVKNDINVLFSGNNPMSFEQVYAQLNYADYSTASAAIDELVEQGSICHRPVDVTSENGTKYVVRVYNSINWPIP